MDTVCNHQESRYWWEEDVGLSLKALLLQKAEEKENLEKDSDAGGNYGGWFWKYVKKECWLMCQMLLFGQVGWGELIGGLGDLEVVGDLDKKNSAKQNLISVDLRPNRRNQRLRVSRQLSQGFAAKGSREMRWQLGRK